VNEIVPYDPPKLLTEREVRAAGVVSNRRSNIRYALEGVQSATLTVRDERGSALNLTLNLPKNDAEALLAFLVERDEQFLTALNIELEP